MEIKQRGRRYRLTVTTTLETDGSEIRSAGTICDWRALGRYDCRQEERRLLLIMRDALDFELSQLGVDGTD